ncbi:unnamed protein product [Didymodactylos carnosus]|uniref:N-acetyltransferase domain-containing protein n=1 Tax=Didymodactylos carnosus TaxID=1234261 RepID=A0A813XPT6_9BILA|nr:unnamed protein product [Didymodactylos carnosus]CAF1395064.1 unnamed protein product [Didymodactylos carnosus]CAF3655561.1 unnamed protein product [Didymodactylos carnosus]CAF4202390.1 unnamed protein product [Didymodactylos carnosus]
MVELFLMKDEHKSQVFNLLIGSFFLQEPLNERLAFNLPHEPLESTEFLLKIAVADQCSYVALDTATSNVVGAIINNIENRHDNDDTMDFKSENLRYIYELIKNIHQNINLFDILNVERLLHIGIVNVDETYRGHKLSQRLITASLERAKQLGIHGAYTEATSTYSCKSFIKNDFKTYKELIYATYDKERLSNLGEHDRCTLLAKIF